MTETIILVLGVLYVAVGLRAIMEPSFIGDIMEDFRNSSGLTYLTGTVVALVCLPLLLLHNEWGTPKQGVASFILWAGLIKGLSFVVFPKVLFGFWGKIFPTGNVSRALGFILSVLGICMIWWVRKG